MAEKEMLRDGTEVFFADGNGSIFLFYYDDKDNLSVFLIY